MFILFKQKELVSHDVSARRVCALPAPLIHDKDKLQIILHDRVIDSPWIDAFGMHSIGTNGAEVRDDLLLNSNDASLLFDPLTDQLNV